VPGRVDFRRGEAWIASGTYQGLPALRAEFRVDETWHRQLAHSRSSGAAHSSQNFASAVFSCWQFQHFIVVARSKKLTKSFARVASCVIRNKA
jgi:hypothetical protein